VGGSLRLAVTMGSRPGTVTEAVSYDVGNAVSRESGNIPWATVDWVPATSQSKSGTSVNLSNIGNPEPRNSTHDWKHQTPNPFRVLSRNTRHETRNLKHETRTLKHETRTPEPETRNPDPETRNAEHETPILKAERRKQMAIVNGTFETADYSVTLRPVYCRGTT